MRRNSATPEGRLDFNDRFDGVRQQQGKREGSRKLLAPVYERFTDGFDTADLKEAFIAVQGPI